MIGRSIRVAGGVCALGVALLAPAVPATAEPRDLDEVYRQLGADAVSADYVVLVDTSSSMNAGNLYASTRESVRQFFAALAPEDGITLISVAERATTLWQGKAGTAPDAVVAKLPPAATGTHTDLGAGIAAAVDALDRQLTNPIASVVLLTDGQHDPAPGSAYPYAEGYGWQELARRAARLKQRISPYAVQLRGANGAAMLKKVFPSTAMLDTGPVDQLTSRLGASKAAVRAAKARQVLAEDAKPSVVVSWPTAAGELAGGTNSLVLTLRSTSRRVPLEVTGLSVGGLPAGMTAEAPPGPFAIAPGQAVQVPVTVRWDVGRSSWRPSATLRQPYTLRTAARVTSPWSALLASEVGVRVEPVFQDQEHPGVAVAQRGSPGWWVAGAAVLVVLLAFALRWRWLRLHPVPGGRLVATRVGTDGPSGSLALGRRELPINASSLNIPGAGRVAGRRHKTRSERLISIAYSSDGSADRAVVECADGGSVEVGGVRFEWHRG
jgi:hypothetical protein